MTRRRERSRPVPARARTRPKQRRDAFGVGRVASTACLVGFGVLLIGLIAIGPPPALRVETLWVNGHRGEIGICLIGLAIAVAATLVALVTRRHLWQIAMLWVLTALLVGYVFSDRFVIIASILLDRVS